MQGGEKSSKEVRNRDFFMSIYFIVFPTLALQLWGFTVLSNSSRRPCVSLHRCISVRHASCTGVRGGVRFHVRDAAGSTSVSRGRCTRRTAALCSRVVALYQYIFSHVWCRPLLPQPASWPPGWVSERSATPRHSVSRRRGRVCRRVWRPSEWRLRDPDGSSAQSAS